MNLLREYIRELLTEGAKTPDDLLRYKNVYVFIQNNGDMMKIFFSTKDGKELAALQVPGGDHWGNPHGAVWIETAKKYPSCGAAWTVTAAGATHGWGPLLYDVAMEWATLNGGGIISDRNQVSHEARAVWDYYMNNRSDVTAYQLDDLQNTLTPEDEDNCNHAIVVRYDKDADWKTSALSKRYTAPPVTLRKLRSIGRLIT